jgi:hypothetical protein
VVARSRKSMPAHSRVWHKANMAQNVNTRPCGRVGCKDRSLVDRRTGQGGESSQKWVTPQIRHTRSYINGTTGVCVGVPLGDPHSGTTVPTKVRAWMQGRGWESCVGRPTLNDDSCTIVDDLFLGTLRPWLARPSIFDSSRLVGYDTDRFMSCKVSTQRSAPTIEGPREERRAGRGTVPVM